MPQSLSRDPLSKSEAFLAISVQVTPKKFILSQLNHDFLSVNKKCEESQFLQIVRAERGKNNPNMLHYLSEMSVAGSWRERWGQAAKSTVHSK